MTGIGSISVVGAEIATLARILNAVSTACGGTIRTAGAWLRIRIESTIVAEFYADVQIAVATARAQAVVGAVIVVIAWAVIARFCSVFDTVTTTWQRAIGAAGVGGRIGIVRPVIALFTCLNVGIAIAAACYQATLANTHTRIGSDVI